MGRWDWDHDGSLWAGGPFWRFIIATPDGAPAGRAEERGDSTRTTP